MTLLDNQIRKLDDARIAAMGRALNKANFTVERIARALDVTQQTVWNWLNNDKIPNPTKEKKYYEYLANAGKEL